MGKIAHYLWNIFLYYAKKLSYVNSIKSNSEYDIMKIIDNSINVDDLIISMKDLSKYKIYIINKLMRVILTNIY